MIADQIHISHKSIVASFAYWAVRLSPFASPDDLPAVLSQLSQKLEETFPLVTQPFVEMPHTEVMSLLRNFIDSNSIVQSWNVPKKPGSSQYLVVSRFSSKPDPDEDFIDLDALYLDIAQQLRKEAIHDT